MLQVLHLDVSKVDRGIAHVIMCDRLLQLLEGARGSGRGADAAWGRVGRRRHMGSERYAECRHRNPGAGAGIYLGASTAVN